MMQLKDKNEDSCHIQKYMQIALTAIVTVLTGRVSGCLFVLSIKFTAAKKKKKKKEGHREVTFF
jgi:heme/copper-type cytochrome/quinol oxidase subunit 2